MSAKDPRVSSLPEDSTSGETPPAPKHIGTTPNGGNVFSQAIPPASAPLRPHQHECVMAYIDDCKTRGYCVCECGERFRVTSSGVSVPAVPSMRFEDGEMRCPTCDKQTPHRQFGDVRRCSECGEINSTLASTPANNWNAPAVPSENSEEMPLCKNCGGKASAHLKFGWCNKSDLVASPTQYEAALLLSDPSSPTRIEYLEAALRELSAPRGRYSRDQLTHAQNVIEDMAKVAKNALDGTWEIPDV